MSCNMCTANYVYQNRKAEKAEEEKKKKQEAEVEAQKQAEASKPKESKLLDTVECGKKILSITKVGDKVVVMYNDCTFATAPVEVVNNDVLSEDIKTLLTTYIKTTVDKSVKDSLGNIKAEIDLARDEAVKQVKAEKVSLDELKTALTNKLTEVDEALARNKLHNADVEITDGIGETLHTYAHSETTRN